MTPAPIRIATRRSALALWQAEFVAAALRTVLPGRVIEVLPMSTRGDEIMDASLASVGGKGLFTKELERAMFDGRADLAVHSLKDVPAELPDGMRLAALLERADPRDALVCAGYGRLADLPDGARIGTSSLRRTMQIKHAFPGLRCEVLRGNVNTRLEKLDRGDFDAIILAVAGLERLGLGDRIRERIDPHTCVPAIGQGILAVECRDDDEGTRTAVAALDHPPTRVCAEAERAVNSGLHGSCHSPVAAFATMTGDRLSLVARVGSPDGVHSLEARAVGTADAAPALGKGVAEDLLAQGAASIMAAAVPVE